MNKVEYVRGARILTLYKQHYLNEYPNAMSSRYSCWGYYDAMEVRSVPLQPGLLRRNIVSAELISLWYGMTKQAERLAGTFSQQNIALIYESKENTAEELEKEESFWNKENVFLAVGFIQLKDKQQAGLVKQVHEDVQNKELKVIIYSSFDNADLVVLVKGDDLQRILDKLELIEHDEDCCYMHTVCGVSEEFLGTLKKALDSEDEDLLKTYDNILERRIKGISMRAVSRSPGIEIPLKAKLLEISDKYKLGIRAEEIKTAYLSGHENLLLQIELPNMKTALALLIPGGFATHQNDLYGKELYNLTTELNQSINPVNKFEPHASFPTTTWASNKLCDYIKLMKEAEQSKDEGIFSYYAAVVKTLNMISQYERFPLSSKIFYMIYPAFSLFDRQLKEALAEVMDLKDLDRMKRMESIRQTLSEFLDSVNSIVYHAIHTDQVFLMIPGNSGTSFSNPTDLSLFYLCYLKHVGTILNDTGYTYQYYLSPVVESKPRTELRDFGRYTDNRLICIRLSQRSLYEMNALLIILVHENAHYVGKNFRLRQKRLGYLVRTLGYLMVEAILPEDSLEEIKKEGKDRVWQAFRAQKVMLQKTTMQLLDQCIEKKIKCENESYSDNDLHAKNIAKFLKEACAEVLAGEELRKSIEIKEAILESCSEETDNIYNKVQRRKEVDIAQVEIRKNWLRLMAEGSLDKIIDDLIVQYREIFSDVMSYALLNWAYLDYWEAISISEGREVKTSDLNAKIRCRLKVMGEISQSVSDEIYQEIFAVKSTGSNDKKQEFSLTRDLYFLDAVQDFLKAYGQEALAALKESQQFQKSDVQLKEIRKIFSLAAGKRSNCCNLSQLFNNIQKFVHNYTKSVKVEVAEEGKNG